jgi:hypothetical protein
MPDPSPSRSILSEAAPMAFAAAVIAVAIAIVAPKLLVALLVLYVTLASIAVVVWIFRQF